MVLLWILIAIIVGMTVLAIIKKPRSVYKNAPEEQNPFEGKKVRFVENENEPENADGKCGHLEAVGDCEHKAGFYEGVIKRCLDIVLSFFGLVILSPLYIVLILAVVIDDPGPVFFVQKRVGKNEQFLVLDKFFTGKITKKAAVLSSKEPSKFVTFYQNFCSHSAGPPFYTDF